MYEIILPIGFEGEVVPYALFFIFLYIHNCCIRNFYIHTAALTPLVASATICDNLLEKGAILMKVLGLIGSPRIKGNTAKLVKEILADASENGAEPVVYNLARMNLSGCNACSACLKKGTCILEDDMQELYRKTEEADVLVLGSPVYMGEISAQAKPFVDRLHPFVHDSSKPLAGKRLVLAYTQGNPNVDTYGKYFEYMEGIFSHVGFDVKCTVAAAGTIGVDDILEQEELLVKAREIGKNL